MNTRLKPMDIHALLALEIPERQMIVDPIIPEKGLAMLYAGRGTGKTFVSIGVSVAGSTGTAFLKWNAPRPCRVLHCDGEMAAVDLRDRFEQAIAGAGVKPEPGMLNILTADLIELGIGNLADTKVQAELDPWLDGVELLVLDNLSSLTTVIRDNDAESWNPIQEWLLRLRRRGVAVLINHHAGKGGGQRGTSRREDVLDTSISLLRPSDYLPDQGARFEVHLEKARRIHGDRARPFEARMELRAGASFWTVREIEDANVERVRALLDEGDLSIRDIAEETGLSKSTVHRIKRQIGAVPVSHPLGEAGQWDTSVPAGQNGGTAVGHGTKANQVSVPCPTTPLGVGQRDTCRCRACDGSGCPTCRPAKFGLGWQKPESEELPEPGSIEPDYPELPDFLRRGEA